jgi:hypothetical protein
MVFLSLNVCNPAFYNANDQNQNLIKARLFKTLIQKCSCLDALVKSLTPMLSKIGQKTLFYFCSMLQKNGFKRPSFKMIVYGISVFQCLQSNVSKRLNVPKLLFKTYGPKLML